MLSAAEANQANRYWPGSDYEFVFGSLVFGKDTDWVRQGDHTIWIGARRGFNPPCFARQADNIVTVYSREFKLCVSLDPFKIVERIWYEDKPLPEHCTKEQWGLDS